MKTVYIIKNNTTDNYISKGRYGAVVSKVPTMWDSKEQADAYVAGTVKSTSSNTVWFKEILWTAEQRVNRVTKTLNKDKELYLKVQAINDKQFTKDAEKRVKDSTQQLADAKDHVRSIKADLAKAEKSAAQMDLAVYAINLP
jgi:hypothetical protein